MTTEDDSPYPEVRSAVANYDDPTMPVSTLRAWSMGIVLSILMAGVNQFFHFRYPSILVGPVSTSLVHLHMFPLRCLQLVAQLIAFPVGRLWARFVPQWRIFGLSLNPGPFTIKEHVC